MCFVRGSIGNSLVCSCGYPDESPKRRRKKKKKKAASDEESTLIADASTMLVGGDMQGGLATVMEGEGEDDDLLPPGANPMMGEAELQAAKPPVQPPVAHHPADDAGVHDWYVSLATRMAWQAEREWGLTEGPIIMSDANRYQYDTELPLEDYAAEAAKRTVRLVASSRASTAFVAELTPCFGVAWW